jgi:peptidoglycan/xylan/chitin deacetylase (PgdA/CDA1 family)
LALALVVLVTVAGCGSGGHSSGTNSAVAAQIANGPVDGPAIGPTGIARVRPTAPGPVPILMYHVIGDVPAGAPYPELWVSPELFAQQMQALRTAGYHAVTLDAVLDNWQRGAPLPSRPIVLSFDDGNTGQSRYAAPVLRRLGWPGVLNLTVDHVGRDGISAARIRGLIAGGWEIDSHTLTHRDLTRLSPEELRAEVAESRAKLRRRFDVPVNAFCYPAGQYDPAVVEAVRSAGYRAATSERPGWATPAADQRYALPRIRVSGGESPTTLLSALTASAG